MDGGVGHALGQTGQDPDCDQQRRVGLGQDRGQQRQHRRGRDAEQKYPLASVFCGKVTSGDLSENISIEETRKNQSLGLGIPIKIWPLK